VYIDFFVSFNSILPYLEIGTDTIFYLSFLVGTTYDPQRGKGACDHKAAGTKAHVHRYINKGKGCLDAK